MSVETVFGELWKVYTQVNPNVLLIRQSLAEKSPGLMNDHIALRTLKHPEFGIARLAESFLTLGYRQCADYHFEQKKLDAIHLEHASDQSAPKVFISELLIDQCSPALQQTIDTELIQKCSKSMNNSALLAGSGRQWGAPSYEVYQSLLVESEYAAWFYVFGFVPNHFTVKVNSLSQFDDIHDLNDFLEAQGYTLNTVGGKVKGSPSLFLEQSSTMAEPQWIDFKEGRYQIPSVFYEFAKRYPMESGVEFSGFVEGNADKIFESTNVAK